MFPPPFVVPGAPDPDPSFSYGFKEFLFAGKEAEFVVPSGVSEVAILIAGGVANFLRRASPSDAIYIGGLHTTPGHRYRVRVGGSPSFDEPGALTLYDEPFEPFMRAGGWNGGGDGWTVPVGVTTEEGTRWVRGSTAAGGASSVLDGNEDIVTVGGEPGLSWFSQVVPPGTILDADSYVLGPPSGPTFRRIVASRPTATQPPRKEYTPAEAGFPFYPVVLPSIVGGESSGGDSFRVTWPRDIGAPSVTTINGAGGGGYGGGCSGLVVDSGSFPGFPPGPPSGFVPLRGNYGASHIKAGLFNAWVPQDRYIPGVRFYWLADGGGAKWRVGRIGWGHGRWS